MRVSTTEKALAEFSLRRQRSSRAEAFAADYLKNRGWNILEQDVEVRHVQVDLLARAPDGVLTIVEVKMQNSMGTAHLSRRQTQRLFAVARFLGEFEPIQMRVAFVEEPDVQLLPVDGLTGF